jgi:5-hydroxyisourate hydrolase-like protein (transthyretin family)
MMGATCGAVSQLQDKERCRNKPLQMQLGVTDTEGRVIVTMHSDQNGYYRIVLAPGEYILEPQKHPFLNVQSIPFEVSDKGFVHINVLYVTGIK